MVCNKRKSGTFAFGTTECRIDILCHVAPSIIEKLFYLSEENYILVIFSFDI